MAGFDLTPVLAEIKYGPFVSLGRQLDKCTEPRTDCKREYLAEPFNRFM